MSEERTELQLSGTIDAVVFENPENGYCVLRLAVNGEQVTVVGCIPAAVVGEQLTVTGKWTAHSAYGEQFAAEHVQRSLPTGRTAIFNFLAFGGIRGVGKATATAIIREFGENALTVIENDPEQLTKLKGISHAKAMQMSSDFRRQTGLRSLMEFLSGFGLRPQYAIRLARLYGEDASAAVRDNPYILAEESIGADFFEADSVALALDFDEECSERLEAALLFELRYNQNNGHTFLPRDKLIDATCQLVGVERELVDDALTILEDDESVICQPVANVNACYLQSMYAAEKAVADRLRAMAKFPTREPLGLDRKLERIADLQQVEYAEKQKAAIELAARHQVMVLTGGPGTGKTTSVRGIIALFELMGLTTALAAPTGRAAKRLTELTGREAFTIHRLLGAGYTQEGDELTFEHDLNNPLDTDAVILDETSMVDIRLMAALLEALPPRCRLVLVGDADQLPSVGPGNVFRDIIRSGIVETIALTEIFRQAEQSDIVRNAHRINHGEMPDLGKNKGDFFFLQRASRDKLVSTVAELCTIRLPKNMGIPTAQIQVLAPYRRHEAGTLNLNKVLQEAINPADPSKPEKLYGEFLFRTGDKVMQIRNNYDILWTRTDDNTEGSGIFNGDIGAIELIDTARERVGVRFDDRYAEYTYDQLSELEPAYAATVHKSQGSEFRAVILAISRGSGSLMTRSVLYTAVTRARDLLIIVGDDETIAQMVQNDKQSRRYSGLRARLAGEVDD